MSPQWILVALASISVLIALVGLGLNIYWRHRPVVPPQRGAQSIEISQLADGRKREGERSEGGDMRL